MESQYYYNSLAVLFMMSNAIIDIITDNNQQSMAFNSQIQTTPSSFMKSIALIQTAKREKDPLTDFRRRIKDSKKHNLLNYSASFGPSQASLGPSHANLSNNSREANALRKQYSPVIKSRKMITESGSDTEQVVMQKKELLEFTKQFASLKVEYEQKIEKMAGEIAQKNSRILVLDESVEELREDQHRMEDIIEQLKLRHENQLELVIANMNKQIEERDQRIEGLQHQMQQLEFWNQQEQQENKKLTEFLKLKEQIINNLQTTNNHYGQSSPPPLPHKRIHKIPSTTLNNQYQSAEKENMKKSDQQNKIGNKSPCNRKVIIKKIKNKSQKTGSGRDNHQQFIANGKQICPELRSKQLQILSLNQTIMRIEQDNQRLSARVKQLSSIRSHEEFSNNHSRKDKECHHLRQQLLMQKCMELESCIQRLISRPNIAVVRNNTVQDIEQQSIYENFSTFEDKQSDFQQNHKIQTALKDDTQKIINESFY